MKSFKVKDRLNEVVSSLKKKLRSIRASNLIESVKTAQPLQHTYASLVKHKMIVLKTVGSLCVFAAVSVGGNQFVNANMKEVFHVYVDGQEAGVVSDPQVVEQYVINKYKEVQESNPDKQMVLNTDAISYKSERAFMAEDTDQTVLDQLGQMLTAKAIGAEIKVDGKVVGVVKDKETASQVLEELKAKFVPKPKENKKVMTLSASQSEQPSGTTELVSDGFMQQVEVSYTDLGDSEPMNPEDLLQKLQTGDVQPTKYTVQKGDCVSCIAKKLEISRQVIYQNNPWIVDDKIKEGQVLDLTVLQPTLTVKTVERVVENQEMQHDVVYQKDATLRQGITKTIKPGKNGMKQVTYLITKANGLMMDEEVLEETVIEEPVSEVAVKGSKVVLGEGTGRFSWPVLGASITSTFGTRWGKMHKGVDLSGNRNIMASDNGVVVFTGNRNDGYGNQIVIDHQNGYRTLYGHLSSITTTTGKVVEKGEKIGIMGSTGDSTGVHLHFEVQKGGVAENPLKYLSR
ncbi:M23 family metallopeptidase [Paenibacillus sp. y28]|uniref:M23 family metallopeptidase n=1 Tax=Paenibacillus sp. y28 TaxID=3129110 RepID=UPI003017CE27